MAKVRVLGTPLGDEGTRVQPTGTIDGQNWPDIGEEFDVSDATAAALVESDIVELVDGKKVEKRPASTRKTETR